MPSEGIHSNTDLSVSPDCVILIIGRKYINSKTGRINTNQPVCTLFAYFAKMGMIKANKKGDKIAKCKSCKVRPPFSLFQLKNALCTKYTVKRPSPNYIALFCKLPCFELRNELL